MATTHSSVLAWRIPGMGEPGGLPSKGSHRVRYDGSELPAAAAAAAEPRRQRTSLEYLLTGMHTALGENELVGAYKLIEVLFHFKLAKKENRKIFFSILRYLVFSAKLQYVHSILLDPSTSHATYLLWALKHEEPNHTPK